ncbi:MAG: aspartyl/asparaginyl beta-hydroxylase domain-containing protein [Alphaproteobacteria bacterium]
MANSADVTEISFADRFRQKRRKVIKKFGKRLIRRLGDFLGRQSTVGDMPVFETQNFDWAVKLEQNWAPIRQELDTILKNHEALPSFHEISPDQAKISKGDQWKTFILLGFGYKAESNCALCPETTRVLESIPNIRTAFFSILAPGYHIPHHRGVTKGVIRGHLAMVVPEDRENCWIRVGEERVSWRQGDCLVFDDTFDHEVQNDTPDRRVVLLIDVDRPMRFWGRLINKGFMAGIRWTAYVQDAKKNMQTAEQRLEAAVGRADALHIDGEDEAKRPKP